MITLYTSFQQKEFSCQVPDIRLAISLTRVLLSVTVTKSGDQEEIYSEYLYPDRSGVITLSDMDRLVKPYADKWLTFDLGVNIKEEKVAQNSAGIEVISNTSERSLATTVVSCKANILNMTASSWCSSRFLTLMDGARTTAIGWMERLSYVGNETPTCTAYYVGGSSLSWRVPVLSTGDVTVIDTSSENFVSSGRELLRYVVVAGSRRMVYEVDLESEADTAPVLLFWNSFGVQELAYCTGELKQVSSFDRKQTRIGRLKKTYDMEERESFKADTGILTFPMANWWREVLRSEEIFVCSVIRGSVDLNGKPVVITSEKMEMSNAPDALPRITFEYEYADRNHNIFDVRAEGRIFDDTFDYTFN